MSRPCFSLSDVESRLKLVLQWFGNDTTEFIIHLSIYLHNHLKQYKPKLPKLLTYEGDVQSKQGEEKKKESETKTVTDMSKETKVSETDSLFKALTSAIEQGSGVDLLKLLIDNAGGQKMSLEHLKDAQQIRRKSTLNTLTASLNSDGRKLSAVEKNLVVIEEACKLADQEEEEEEKFNEQDDYEEFVAGDEVIIIEGENSGLFGTLQHSSEGLFGIFGDAIKEDEEGNYGVDVHTENGEDEGYWIHPEAIQHKKYIAGDKVKVIDGINVGRTGTIQVDGVRLRMDDGAYGVDVKMDDGTLEGYWIHPTSMKPLEPHPEKTQEEEEEEELEEIDKFEFLPYIPLPGDVMDEALAEAVNTFEIDINIKRIVTRNNNIVYRYDGRRHLIRYIHGVLLVKKDKVWCELLPVLRKLAGLPAVPSSDLYVKKGKKK